MVWWLEHSLAEHGDLSSIPAHSKCPMRYGLVVRAVAFEARGPGFDSSSDRMVFILGRKEVRKMDPDTIQLRDFAYPLR